MTDKLPAQLQGLNLDHLSRNLADLVSVLPETLNDAQLREFAWLRRLVLVADDLSNRVSRADLDALKSGRLG